MNELIFCSTFIAGVDIKNMNSLRAEKSAT